MKKIKNNYDWDKVLELIKQGEKSGTIALKLNIPVMQVCSWKSRHIHLWETKEQSEYKKFWNKSKQENDTIKLIDGKVIIVRGTRNEI